jgi:hypothetical protein
MTEQELLVDCLRRLSLLEKIGRRTVSENGSFTTNELE